MCQRYSCAQASGSGRLGLKEGSSSHKLSSCKSHPLQASGSSSERMNVNSTNLVSVIRRTPWDNAPVRPLTRSLAPRMDASHHYFWVFYFCSWSYSSSWQSVRSVTFEPGLFHIYFFTPCHPQPSFQDPSIMPCFIIWSQWFLAVCWVPITERDTKGEKERGLGLRHMGCIKGPPDSWWAGKDSWVLALN